MGDRQNSEPTISDVANAAGVSIRTVSRVLNRSLLVNSETRERVQLEIARLNFSPSARARALALRRSFLVAMIHNDRNALVLDTVQRGVVEESAQRGYELVVHPVAEATQDAIKDIIDFVRRSRVDGLVILPPVSGVSGLPEALQAERVPTIALSPVPIDGYLDIILSQERAAAAEVAEYLLELGHRQIALLNGPQMMMSASERRAGFIASLHAAGVDVMEEFDGDYTFPSGLDGAYKLLSLSPRPTAIFAANDIMAAAVLKVASALDIKVPQDLSVVGFDGSILAQMLTPALTTVSRPFGEMARRATSYLLDHIEGRQHQHLEHFPLLLVKADSAAAVLTKT